MHELSALLVNRRQRVQLALCRQVRLLGEFAPRRGDEILARLDEALRDSPDSIVLFCPERPARMCYQDFQGGLAPAFWRSGASPPWRSC